MSYFLKMLFYLTKSPKLKDNEHENHKIFTFLKLEPAILWHFCLKHCSNNYLIKI